MKPNLTETAGGRKAPVSCVTALTEFENVWPGASFHNARTALVSEVMEALGKEVRALVVNIDQHDPYTEAIQDVLQLMGLRK